MHTSSRRHALRLFVLGLAVAGFGLPAIARADDDGQLVFTSSNASAGNALMVYATASDGSLTLRNQLATGGLGSGAGLGSQGAVTLSGDGRYLFVVNAQSNTVSTFMIRRGELRRTSVVDSGGLHPISVTEHNGLVYVLNDQGAGNVAGFRNARGELQAIAGSARGLSAAGGTAPAQVGFGSDGDVLVVTEKATNRLTSYPVLADGRLGAPVVSASAGATPFGFAFDNQNHLLVSEAFGGAVGASAVSSYRFTDAAPATPILVSASVPTTQTAACWVVTTPNGKFAYATNTGSSSVSSYRVARSGQIELAAAIAGNTGAGSSPIDAAVSRDGHRLFVLNAGSATISAFGIAMDGSLSAGGGAAGLPGSAVGLAAN